VAVPGADASVAVRVANNRRPDDLTMEELKSDPGAVLEKIFCAAVEVMRTESEELKRERTAFYNLYVNLDDGTLRSHVDEKIGLECAAEMRDPEEKEKVARSWTTKQFKDFNYDIHGWHITVPCLKERKGRPCEWTLHILPYCRNPGDAVGPVLQHLRRQHNIAAPKEPAGASPAASPMDHSPAGTASSQSPSASLASSTSSASSSTSAPSSANSSPSAAASSSSSSSSSAPSSASSNSSLSASSRSPAPSSTVSTSPAGSTPRILPRPHRPPAVRRRMPPPSRPPLPPLPPPPPQLMPVLWFDRSYG